jgi:tetratricopeptide (TPR) repeat protein
MAATGQALEKQVQGLLKQNKHEAALRKLQQGLKRDPEQAIAITEADIWRSQGKHEYEQAHYAKAETALGKVLELSPSDEDAYYWLAKCLLAQERPAEALALFQSAFDSKKLSKEMGGCYLKLLLLNGQVDQVQSLIDSQAKRFFAPQLHWARGAIALKANQPKAALDHFNKISRPISTEDHLAVWGTYAQQQLGNWSEAESSLAAASRNSGFPNRFGTRFIGGAPEHSAIQLLTLYQVAHTSRVPARFSYINSDALTKNQPDKRGYASWVLELLNFIRQENVYDAAHLMVEPPDGIMDEYPALQRLRIPMLLLAGEQAAQHRELEDSAFFWGEVLEEKGFEPNLALNLHQALNATGYFDEDLKLLDQFVRWLRQTAQQNPQDWPEKRLNDGLALLYCWKADSQIYSGREKNAIKAVQAAEKLSPEHPEVMGRKGLILYTKSRSIAGTSKDKDKAIELLTKALAAGSQFKEIYSVLCAALADDSTALKEIRQKYGPAFGDAGADTEVEVPDWVEALSFRHYRTMAQFVSNETKTSGPIKACRIFLEAAEDEPSSGQKVTLNQKKAVAEWQRLLESAAPAEQVEILKAVYLTLQQHAKRNQKGMKALQRSYLKQMADLSKQQVPGADVGYLLLQAIASANSDATTKVVDTVLKRSTEPSQTLARAQLELRQFGPNTALKSSIEAQLKRDSQNPLLLLAAATLYQRHTAQYETRHERGFEIARRLQDTEALQAYRVEDWWIAQEMTRQVVGPDIDLLNANPSQIDMLDLVRRMAKQAFGGQLPDEIIDQMMPELIEEMMGLPGDDAYEPNFEEIFRPAPLPRGSRGRKSSKKRR